MIWRCLIGHSVEPLPRDANYALEMAVAAAYEKLTGRRPDVVECGWYDESNDLVRTRTD